MLLCLWKMRKEECRVVSCLWGEIARSELVNIADSSSDTNLEGSEGWDWHPTPSPLPAHLHHHQQRSQQQPIAAHPSPLRPLVVGVGPRISLLILMLRRTMKRILFLFYCLDISLLVIFSSYSSEDLTGCESVKGVMFKVKGKEY